MHHDYLGKILSALPEIEEIVLQQYPTVEDMDGHWEEIIVLPQVKSFLASYMDFREAGRHLIESKVVGKVQKTFPGEQQELIYMGYRCPEHGIVAKAIKPVESRMGDGRLEKILQENGITTSQMVYSHHDEIIEGGKLYCPAEGNATERVMIGRAIFFRSKVDREAIEEEVVNRVYSLLKEKNVQSRHTPETFREDIERALGVGSTYSSLFDALEQGLYYTVTFDDLFEEHEFNFHNGNVNGNRTRTGSLVDMKLLLSESLEEAASDILPPPEGFVMWRTKGASFADKYIFNRFNYVLNEEIDDLTDFVYASTGSDIRSLEPRSLDDFFGVRVLTFPRTSEEGMNELYSLIGNLTGLNTSEVCIKEVPYEKFLERATDDSLAFALLSDEQAAMLEGTYAEQELTTRDIYESGEAVRYNQLPAYYLTGIDNLEEIVGGVIRMYSLPEDSDLGTVLEVEDYFRNVKPSGYRTWQAVFEIFDGIKVELQVRDTHTDGIQELSEGQNHQEYKQGMRSVVDYLAQRPETSARVHLLRKLLTPHVRTYALLEHSSAMYR